MPIDAAIPLGIKVPDAMSTIGNIANTANAIQQYKTGQLQQQRVGVQLQQEQGALDARRAIADIMPTVTDPATGLVDLNSLATKGAKADPGNYLWQDIVSKAAAANNDMLKVRQTGLALANQEQEYISQRAGALSLDPNVTTADIHGMLDDAQRIAPNAKPMIDIARAHLETLPNDPRVLQAALQRFRNLAFPVSAQAPQTSIVPTGGGAVPTQTNQLGGAVGPVAGAAVIPQPNEQVGTDINGNQVRITKDVNGRISVAPLPVQPGTGGAPHPQTTMPAGETPQTRDALTQLRTNVNQAAAKVPEQHFNNQQIVRLADEGYTGSSANFLSKLFSSVGLQYIPGDKTANFQQLGHFLALQTQANAQAMGVQNIPGQLTAEAASGSTAWDAKAIKRATKVNDALATGVDLFNRGMENAINDPNNRNGIFAARQFQNQWSKTFDVNAMRWHNAIQNGDKEEQAAVLKSVGGKGSPGAKALQEKLTALDSLIGGQ